MQLDFSGVRILRVRVQHDQSRGDGRADRRVDPPRGRLSAFLRRGRDALLERLRQQRLIRIRRVRIPTLDPIRYAQRVTFSKLYCIARVE